VDNTFFFVEEVFVLACEVFLEGEKILVDDEADDAEDENDKGDADDQAKKE